MKSVVILGDGMADVKIKQLNNKTILDYANKPNMDMIAKMGIVGLAKTVPDGQKPGSDNANLSVMGYNPLECYTGRSPLEAVSIGVELDEDDVTFRCNLVNLSSKENFEDKIMIDYSSDEISTEEARELIEALKPLINTEVSSLFAGVSYRHCLKVKGFSADMNLVPPHDISDKCIRDYLPKGEEGKKYLEIYKKAYDILDNHPVNINREKRGLRKANSMWLWGMGTKPALLDFYEKNRVKGAVISAVDLIKGIGILSGMNSIDVVGATGNVNTNFEGKADACIEAFKNGADFVYLHMEAPDEAGHRGEIENKVKAVELIDSIVVKKVYEYLQNCGEDFNILIMPDHPTPICLKTHTSDPVPFAMYKSKAPQNCQMVYNEDNALKSGIYYEKGYQLLTELLK